MSSATARCGAPLLAVAADKVLEARVGAQRREMWAGIDGGEIAVTGGECFFQRGQSFLFVVAPGIISACAHRTEKIGIFGLKSLSTRPT